MSEKTTTQPQIQNPVKALTIFFSIFTFVIILAFGTFTGIEKLRDERGISINFITLMLVIPLALFISNMVSTLILTPQEEDICFIWRSLVNIGITYIVSIGFGFALLRAGIVNVNFARIIIIAIGALTIGLIEGFPIIACSKEDKSFIKLSPSA